MLNVQSDLGSTLPDKEIFLKKKSQSYNCNTCILIFFPFTIARKVSYEFRVKSNVENAGVEFVKGDDERNKVFF